MQHNSTLFTAGVIALMALAPSMLSAQKASRAELQSHRATKVSYEERLARETRQQLAAPALKFPKLLGSSQADTPFAVALRHVKAGRQAAQQPVIFHAPQALPSAELAGYLNFDPDLEQGMYTLQLPGASFDFRLSAGAMYSTPSTGCYVQDGRLYSIQVFYMMSEYFFYPCVVNIDNWTDESPVDGLYGNGYEWYPLALTTHPSTGKGFGLFYNADASGYEFCNVDILTAERTVVGTSDLNFITLATAGDGTVYGVAEDGNLYQIDANDGSQTLVGATGVQVSNEEGSYSQTMAIDAHSGYCYWACIDADGNSSMKTIDLTTGAASPLVDYGDKQIFALTVLEPLAENDAPAAVSDLSVNFEGASLSGSIDFTAPSQTFGGNTLTGDLTYSVVWGVNEVTGTVAAGDAVSLFGTFEPGMQQFVVTTSNAYGKSPEAKISAFIGQDTPLAPTGARFDYDQETGLATISWDEVTEGVHQGYVGTVTYNVYDPEGNQVGEALTATTFTLSYQADELGSYAFAIEAVAGDCVSQMAYTNGVVIGNALEVPVYLDFATDEAFALSTVIDANEDDNTWYQSGYGARYSYDGMKEGDDWLITPAIALKGGRTYIVSYKAYPQSTYYTEILEVTMGQGATVADQSRVLVEAYTATGSNEEPESVELRVAVEEDGDYNFGFHCLSPADQFYLHIVSFGIEAAPAPDAPAAPALAVESADGALDYALKVTLPVQTNDGSALGTVSKVRIETNAGEESAIELTGSYAAGETVTYQGAATHADTYSWTVVCYNEAGNGEKATVSKFLGVDAPVGVTGMLTDLGEAVRIDWEPVTEGQNGGYVNPANVYYEVYSIEGGYLGELLTTTSETTLTLPMNTNEGEMQFLEYAIRTGNESGMSDYEVTNAIVIGEPVALPWVEPFDGGNVVNYVWTTTSAANMQIGATEATGDGGAAYFSSPVADVYGSLNTGKITLAGAVNPQVLVSYTGDGGVTADVRIITADLSKTRVLGTLNATTAWLTAMFAIPAEFESEPYIYVSITATVNEAYSELIIDNLMVRDVLDHNLSISLTAPAKLTRGESCQVVAAVCNEGANVAENPAVRFTVGGVETTTTYEGRLEPFQTVEFPFEVTTTLFDESESLDLEAEVVYALDLKPEDNVATAAIALKDPAVVPVDNLAGEYCAEGLQLTWTAPEASESLVEEDFESETWAVKGYPETPNVSKQIPADWNQVAECNGWTMYDLDGGMTYGWEEAGSMPYTNYAFGYAIFDYAQYDQLTNAAHSGSKMLLAMSNTGSGYAVQQRNNDWLITPELNGTAQTITFWCSELTDIYGDEQFEVLYSTTDREVSSFVSLGYYLSSFDWRQVSIDVPEGTRYMAVRYCSDDIFGLMLDDFTFTAGMAAPVSFNVYCEGQLIGSTDQTSYLVQEVAGEVYSVTAVYANGIESAPVSIRMADIVGIEQLAAETSEAPVYNLAGVRVAAPKAGIYVTVGKKIVR